MAQKTIELDEEDVGRIMRVAVEKGLGFSPCARMLLRERLMQIEIAEDALAEASAGN